MFQSTELFNVYMYIAMRELEMNALIRVYNYTSH